MKFLLNIWLLCIVSLSANAALTDLGNGTIDDSSLNVIWLSDANFVKTSCDANNSYWQSFDPSSVANNSGRSKNAICSAGGLLNWYEAQAWVALLNSQNYLGANDWRQPLTVQPDSSCSTQGVDSRGFNCTASQMPHLFEISLGNSTTACGGSCLVNIGPFSNFFDGMYWSSTTSLPNAAWSHSTLTGWQQPAVADGVLMAVLLNRSSASAGPGVQAVPAWGLWSMLLLAGLLSVVAQRKLR